MDVSRILRLVAFSGLDRISTTPAWTGAAAAGIAAERALHSRPPRDHDASQPAVRWHEGGSGPPFLLLNGWTASGLVWPHALVSALERRHRVIRIDNRGTGWSRDAPAPFTMADLAQDAADVLAAVAPRRRATVLGFSLGGMVAQELALNHPGLVDRLLLVATRPPSPAAVNKLAPLVAAMVARPGGTIDGFLHDLWTSFCAPGFADRHPDVMAELIQQCRTRGTPRSGMLRQAQAAAAWTGPGRLRRLQIPTLVVHGRRDPVMPLVNGRRLASLIPGADYWDLAGVGHCVPQEATDRLLAAVASGGSR